MPHRSWRSCAAAPPPRLSPGGTTPAPPATSSAATGCWPASPAVTAAMADYSWQRHLIAHGVYADWVDRGRLRPTHRQWSYYLREVARKADAEIVAGEVARLEAAGDRWQLALGSGEV